MSDGPGPGWQNAREIRLPPMPQIPVKTIITVVIALIILALAFSSYYQVDARENGVVLRFGKYSRTTDPGLHFRIPLIETVYIESVREQKKEEFGYRTEVPGRRTRYSQEDFNNESLMLTGDLNVADVEWIVQYRIQNAREYLFKVREPIATLRDLSEAVMREIVGDHSVDEVITIGRERIAEDAKVRLQELCNEYEIGLKIEQLVLQDVNPPEPVKASFNEVNQAEQQKDQLKNQAWSDYNQAVPRARGQAEQKIRTAEGYATERINNAIGETSRFLALYEEYKKSPRVTRQRMYLETIADVLPRIQNKVIVDENMANVLPLLNLGGGSTTALPKGGQK